MSERKSLFSVGGGGPLDGKDGTISCYEWTTEYYNPNREGKAPSSKSSITPLYFNLHATLDGATTSVIKSLFAGDAAQWDISEDQLTLSPQTDDQQLWGGTEFATFVGSLIENGYPETEIPEPGGEVNFGALVGTRVRFAMVPVLDRDTGKPKTHIAKRGQYKGKEFKDKTVVVSKVYDSAPQTRQAAPSQATGKPNGSLHTEPVDEDEVATLGAKTLTKVLRAAKNHTIKYRELTLALTKALAGNPLRDNVVQYCSDTAVLAEMDGITIDLESKGREISLEGIPF